MRAPFDNSEQTWLRFNPKDQRSHPGTVSSGTKGNVLYP